MESKFCPHCGAGVNPNSGLFCGACGKQVEKTNPSAAHVKAPGNKKPLIMGVAAVVVILAVILGMVACSNPKNAVIGKWVSEEKDEWEFFKDGTLVISGSSYSESTTYGFTDKEHIAIELFAVLLGKSEFEIKITGDEMFLDNYYLYRKK